MKQPGFRYNAFGLFSKTKRRMQKFKETRDSSYIYWNELERACFHHDITYGDLKNLARRRASSDKLLRDKTFKIANNPKYDWR